MDAGSEERAAEEMKIRKLFLLHTGLSTFIFLFIVKRILSPSVMSQDAYEPLFHPQRQSATLQDEAFSYHLNLSLFLSEYPHLQTDRCSVLLTPELTRDPPLPLLLLAVKSKPQSTGRRSVLRQTWARQRVVEGYMVRPVFLMAQTNSSGFMKLVEEESKEYNDILQWDFTEGHHNLSLKERCFLEWLHFNVPHVRYVFKGDDDEFVNPSALVRYIKEHGTPRSLHGALQHHSIVLRYSKYQVSTSLFPNPKYPNFLSGGGYLFPGASLPLLYRASQEIPVFPLDDVYLGFLVLAANLSLTNDKRFYVWGLKFDPCHFRQALVVHGINMENLVKMWAEVQEAKCEPAKAAVR
ncbi:PREDICTED: beta-1,3-galactosyltransferase 5-like [Nanorana parkeri]|uniref:beta-1,3-galactosyltransferase 5-like n=1 Tax=Nanorana parkeri TaxID=125878 RepID=UPI0008543ED5|nr:PREDICTED: beta-1,3-galactosyltransferase 5-like [Nanorana parkeri]